MAPAIGKWRCKDHLQLMKLIENPGAAFAPTFSHCESWLPLFISHNPNEMNNDSSNSDLQEQLADAKANVEKARDRLEALKALEYRQQLDRIHELHRMAERTSKMFIWLTPEFLTRELFAKHIAKGYGMEVNEMINHPSILLRCRGCKLYVASNFDKLYLHATECNKVKELYYCKECGACGHSDDHRYKFHIYCKQMTNQLKIDHAALISR